MKVGKNRFGLLVAVALGIAAAVPAGSQARVLFATTNDGMLVSFQDRATKLKASDDGKGGKKSSKAVEAKSSRRITGLPAGASLVGIDFRPKTGELIGIGSDSVPYRLLLDDPRLATAVPIPPAPGGTPPGLFGSSFGVDFNPVPDAIRITSDARLNYRVSPVTGNHSAGSPDMALGPGAPSIVGAGYSNSGLSAVQPIGPSTTLFTVDSNADTLNTQGSAGGTPISPNTGTQLTIGLLGVDIGSTVGFDVIGPFGTTTGILTNAARGKTTLYSVDLSSGETKRIGEVVIRNKKKGSVKASILTGLSAVQ